ncbi:putative dehydrogenase [Lewinella aquimaris]|uniref:Putative dehydrogenase n=1 Tax=Neolewinella aquimaris TaxID=1835722 RepID=A0A840EH05_9BACT|nr:Gfo/Idh/MocA family oxidoreductase [Neolewinella aquimaris]MBB4081089.1 putative dehydrogenase [Neolewinella aquimaris]
MSRLNRRNFLQKTTLFTAGTLLATRSRSAGYPAAAGEYMGGYAAPKIANIRAAFIGVGARGGQHVTNFAKLPGTEVVAISDLYEDNVAKWREMAGSLGQESQHQDIEGYFGGENEWKRMLEEQRPDVVFIATNWAAHAPMATAAMEAGAHAFVEVPIALTIEEMWSVIDTSERTQKHCMMLENVNYSRDELLFLNLVRQGMIGEVLHAEAAYIHDLRGQMEEVDRGTGSWRTEHYAKRDGNLYPTHGLGPVAQYMNLARGEDNFRRLTSFSTPSRGRSLYAKKNYPADHRWNQLEFKGGDLNTSLIKTELGRTVMVQWDETSPRPYTRHNLIQGTLGALAGFPTRVALEGGVPGATEDHHRWAQGEQLQALYEQYDHPLYKRLNETAKGSGHGGMDGIMMVRIVECLQQGLPLDQNVYEGCYWSAVAPLSEASVAADGMPQDFPDFTRGRWRETEPLGVVE